MYVRHYKLVYYTCIWFGCLRVMFSYVRSVPNMLDVPNVLHVPHVPHVPNVPNETNEPRYISTMRTPALE